MKELKFADLIKLYKDGVDADNSMYAEQRSNLMLVAGNHYSKKNSRFWNRVRDDRGMSNDQKIRLTKNHIQRVCKIYENNILSYSPAVQVGPKNESELQDQKAAELNNSVWSDTKQKWKFKDRTREFCQDFVRIGEAAGKLYWDEMKGRFLGYEAAIDPLSGQPAVDETGQPAQDKTKPRFTGDLALERIFGFNLFRAKEAKSMDESWFIGHRKMVDVEELKQRVGNDEEKLKHIQATKDETYVVFDGASSGYSTDNQNQCLVMEMFIRPCAQYPQGYFYIYTNAGILWEGELPFGIFPIVYVGFDEVPTNPRCHSIIKHLRPYQAEINRAGSMIAETQIQNGSDKIFFQPGQKMQNGGMLPGMRGIQISGGPPTILPGRTGDQYLPHIESQIREMYQIANVQEDLEEKSSKLDPYTALFASMDQKKKYVIYSSKFMQFLISITEVSLSLIREYADEQTVIPMIGRSEFVNIKEFKNSQPLSYTIKLEEGTEDMESKLGRQLTFSQIIQYVGNQLDKETIGKLIRTSPYANNESATEDLTVDYDNGTNMILAIDRGEQFQIDPNDKADYMLKRLVTRMRKSDFKMLQQPVQQLYQSIYQQYIQLNTDQQRKIQEAALGYIPMQGMAVVCDIYVPMPGNASKTQRARVPYDSLMWLLKRLEEQGMNQQALMQHQQGALADIATQLSAHPPQAPSQDGGELSQPQLNPQLTQTQG